LKLADESEAIAALFNAIFFIRAIEDHQRNLGSPIVSSLRDAVGDKRGRTVQQLVSNQLELVTQEAIPKNLLDFELLDRFDQLDAECLVELVSDFYENRFAPYAFDFSLMSKHALSRIYERYISILRPVEIFQKTLFSSTDAVTESPRRDLGEVYTPQYIARFFVRFLQENMSPARFRGIRAIDPACGSGMFLRTLLEIQCDPSRIRDIDQTASQAFQNISGIDVEPNAIKAARLSLCLLHLVLTGKFPQSDLKIECANAIEVFNQREIREEYDAVIANPPYVRWENVPEKWHQLLLDYLAQDVSGRPDLYLAFIKIAIENVAPNGFLLFVIPHTFLLSSNAKGIRDRIFKQFWIRHLVDLSAVNVFESASSYPILLIAERKQEGVAEAPAFITKCTAFIGEALQAALAERKESNDFYSVYSVSQSFFSNSEWRMLSPKDYELARKIDLLPRLDTLFSVNQGVNSGADSVFLRPVGDVPNAERRVYVPLLRDREMERYRIPDDVSSLMFYPFEGDRLLDEKELQDIAPDTWAYLERNYETLSRRSSTLKGSLPWWRPERPRVPSSILRPKLVGPHLILFPKFSFDVAGIYCVSRTIFLTHRGDEEIGLWYLLAVLNSSIGHWQIATQSHRVQFRIACETGANGLMRS